MAFFINLELHKHNLSLIADQSNEVLDGFCNLAKEYFTNGRNENKFNSVAAKLGTSPETVERAVESLVCLLMECIKFNITDEHFARGMKGLELNAEKVQILWQFVQAKNSVNEKILKKLEISELRFRDLEWRLEAKIASRTLLNQAEPKITMKLHLDSEVIDEHKDKLNETNRKTSKQEILLQTDLTNLTHIISELEQALVEAKTHRTRNFLKTFQE